MYTCMHCNSAHTIVMKYTAHCVHVAFVSNSFDIMYYMYMCTVPILIIHVQCTCIGINTCTVYMHHTCMCIIVLLMFCF